MPAASVHLFEVDGEYLFAHYFERQHVFEALREYYDAGAYRFEVPAGDREEVRGVLREAGYDPVVVEDPEPYCVVIDRYDEHADILKRSVANWTRRGHRFFLMRDDHAVERALERGAERVEETEFALGI